MLIVLSFQNVVSFTCGLAAIAILFFFFLFLWSQFLGGFTSSRYVNKSKSCFVFGCNIIIFTSLVCSNFIEAFCDFFSYFGDEVFSVIGPDVQGAGVVDAEAIVKVNIFVSDHFLCVASISIVLGGSSHSAIKAKIF